MGWLWNSSDPSASSVPPPQQEPLLEPSNSSLSASNPSPPTQTETLSSNDSPRQTRDQAANAEFLAFLASLQTPSTPTPNPASTNPPQPTETSKPPLPPPPSSSEAITPHHLYPSTISCRALFDSAFYCQSPGGQFKNIYRYGTLRDCSSLWKDFWWCMRTNRGWMSEEEREEQVLMHEWEREGDRLKERGGSSEDVWGVRRRVLKGAFGGEWPEEGGWGKPLTQGVGGEEEEEEGQAEH